MSDRYDSMLMLGGLEVPLYSRLDWSQSYGPIGGNVVLRMASGAGVKLTHWRKWATAVSAGGNIPPGLDGLDYDNPLEMRCAKPMTMGGTGLVYTLPAARRSDTGFTPLAFARVGRQWVPAEVNTVVNTATITAVTGAELYQVRWWPQLTVLCEPPSVDHDVHGGQVRWSLDAEEV